MPASKETMRSDGGAPGGWRRGALGTRVGLRQTFPLGLKNLWLHRLRSFLTMLGIVFGVSSVIAMLAVGEGASHAAQEQIRRQGSQNIILRSVKPPEDESGAQGQSYTAQYGLTYHDIQRIRATIPSVQVVVPGRIIRKKAWNVGYRVDCDIVGTVPWYPAMLNRTIATGRFFTETEMRKTAAVCVLEPEILDALFPLEAALGRAVRIGSNYYAVIGIMAPQGATVTGGSAEEHGEDVQGASARIYIPLSTARSRFGEVLVKQSSGSRQVERVELHEVTVKVAQLEDVVETSLIIEDLLERFHKKKDYTVIVPLEQLRAAEETTRIFNIVLGAIAGISLLVGGIGIMNIMLANVTERTREIGIRRALGAKRRDIVLQFLVETVILSGTGGLIGVALGVTVPAVITFFSDMATVITFWSPILAFSISALIGVVFGLYPALRAADMKPVDALRHE